ncbi:MBL fold metallo-hydrolase [Ruicaihuangia caeni]|uniref:MBL fold metallo-hydrolase n=1 Tax=Ruicaihuangia caeni TaxID=3042517 RepID=UPI0030EF35C8
MTRFTRPVVRKNIAPGIHMIQHADVNAFIVQDGHRGMVIDAGLPGMWPLLSAGLEYLGLRAERLEALVLTHGHFDHVGNAERLRAAGVPVYVHKNDARLVRHPYTYRHEKSRALFPLTHPGGLPSLARMALYR